MRHLSTSALFLAALAACALSASVSAAQDVPATMTVQGVLRDDAGVPVQDGVTLHFSLVDASGTELWSESHAETLRAGLFSLTLGDTTPVPASAFSAELPPKLVIAINDDPALDPIELTSVAYAFRAQSAASVDTFTGDVSWGQLVDVPGSLADGGPRAPTGLKSRESAGRSWQRSRPRIPAMHKPVGALALFALPPDAAATHRPSSHSARAQLVSS